MKKGILIVLLSALVGGLTAHAVVNGMQEDFMDQAGGEGQSEYRTINLDNDNWPDFTYAAESAVDAVVYVQVVSTSSSSDDLSSIFEYFFGYGTPQQREKVASGSRSEERR